MSNIVAIVGRPNVGKSTFFNRLVEKRIAIVGDEPGVTRDRNYGQVEWNGILFSLIDTGGYISNSDDIFEGEIRRQVHLAIDESDIILFIIDVESGVTSLDMEVANILRRSGKKVFAVVNKVDNTERLMDANECYELGFEKMYKISSINGFGTGDLLDDVVKSLSKSPEKGETDIPRIAIVGRPNVGKSSTINALVGEERHVVTEIAGTTRDSISQRYSKFGYDFILVDTAGLRKKKNVKEDIEFYSVLRSVRAIESSDICLLLIDATTGAESQDVSIFHLIVRNKKGVVVVVNKWDLIDKDNNTLNSFKKSILSRMEPFTDVPVIFTSALTKQRILKALESALAVYENRRKRIPTSKLNEVLLKSIEKYPPPSVKGKYVKIKYVTQLPSQTPAFAFYCNLPQYVKEPYKRYLENKVRENFDFHGVPLQIYMRKK